MPGERTPLAALFPPEAVRAIALGSWGELWRACGATVPASVANAKDDAARYAAIECALRSPQSLPPHLAAALVEIAALAGPNGGAALLEAARDLGVDLGAPARRSRDESAEVAARVVLASTGDARFGAVLARARARIARETWGKPTRLFIAKARAREMTRAEVGARAAALRELIAAARDDLSSSVEVATIDDEGPQVRMQVLRGRGHAPDLSRSLAWGTSDLIRFDPARGRLFISTADAAMVTVLREAFGLVFVDDKDAFPLAPSCTLRPLRELGARALHASSLKSAIARARVIRFTWDSGDDDLLEHHGRDCFAAARRRGERLRGGRITSATIRVELAGSPVPCDVRVRPPFGVDLPDGPLAAFAEAYLDAIGLVPWSATPDDLWSIEPWIHPERRMRAALGDATYEALDAAGLVERVQVRAVEHPDFAGAGRALLALPIDAAKGEFYGASMHEDVPSKTLGAADVTVRRLDVAALATRIAHGLDAAGVKGSASTEAIDTGDHALFDLGERSFGAAARVRLFFLAGAPGENASRLIALIAGAARAVVLVPPGERSDVGVAEVALENLAGGYEALVPSIVRAAKLEDDVDAVWIAPKGARLVFDGARDGQAWFDGARLKLSEALTRYVDLLTAAPGRFVTKEAVLKRLSPGSKTDGVERNAKMRVIQAIEAALEASGRPLSADLREGVIEVDRARGHRVIVEVFRR